jgi:hypothetical protein
MTECSLLRDDLTDAALGEPISNELRIHLLECSACAIELERQRELGRRMDVVITRVAREQPPTALLPRTIAATQRAPRRLWTRAWTSAALGTALAASIIGVTIGVRTLHPPPTLDADAARLAAWHSPTGALLVPRDSVLQAPLRDSWFDPTPQPLHSQRTPGGSYGA